MATKQTVHSRNPWSEKPEHFDFRVDPHSFISKEWVMLVSLEFSQTHWSLLLADGADILGYQRLFKQKVPGCPVSLM